ncbi:hypothetical protein Tco_0009729 [Tanacetum coccineum]
MEEGFLLLKIKVAFVPTLLVCVIKAIHGAQMGKIDEISGVKGEQSCWIIIIKEDRRAEEKGINPVCFLFMKRKLGDGLSTLFWDDVCCGVMGASLRIDSL